MYIYIYMCVYNSIYIYISLSLSLPLFHGDGPNICAVVETGSMMLIMGMVQPIMCVLVVV